MSETLTWNFAGNDRLTDILDKLSLTLVSVDRKLADFGRTSTKVKAESDSLQEGIKGVGDEATKTGDKTSRAFRGLDVEIAATAVELRALQAEFSKTGDVDVLKKIGTKKSDLSKMSSVFKDLGGDAEKVIAKAVGDSLDDDEGLIEKIGNFLPDAMTNPAGLAAISAAAVTIGALVLAGIGGAITAAGGIAIAGAGIAGAVMGDPKKFGDAWTTQIDHVKADFIAASKPFAGPTLDAIRSIGPLIDSWHLDGTFAKAAAFVGPLVDGVEQMATYIEAGVDGLVTNAGPVIGALEQSLPALGSAIQTALDSISSHADGGAAALQDILTLIDGLIIASGGMVGTAETAFEVFTKMDAEITNFVANNQSWIAPLTFGLSLLAVAADNAFNADKVEHFGRVLPGTTDSMDNLAASAGVTKKQMQDLSDQFDDLIGKELGAENATLAFNKELLGLTETVKKNGHDISENTEKGIANRQYVLSAIADAERSREANMANGQTVVQATAAYDAQISTLRAHLKQAGFTTEQINELTAAANNVPSQIDIEVNLKGASAAGSAIAALISSTGGKITSTKAHRALGGAVMPGGTYQVNEQGIETFQPNSPGRIVPAGQGGSGSDVLGVLQVVHTAPDGEVLRTELLELKRQRGLTSLGF